ncbi:thioredoxin family protein [Planctellipticum variicoloris]|uniref:thioredoxin family protein n=1 Tax=Planctellipticum variicoloris TaxID=3064265 RepID=UPI003013F0E6|nr:thioredoxin family protein [Planctomycetaceae bacterium SH412]
MATIQVLGTGCPKCGYLAANAARAVEESGRNDVIEKVTDIMQILEFAPAALPALAIDGKVVFAGTLPSPEQIRRQLETTSEARQPS